MAASPASPPLPLLPFHHPWLSPPYFLPLVSRWTVAVPEEEQNRQSSPVEYQLTGRWSESSPTEHWLTGQWSGIFQRSLFRE